MPKEKEDPKAPPPGQVPKKKSGKMAMFLTLVIVGLAMTFMMPTVLLLLAGLIPTYVAFFTDTDTNKSGAVSVGAMNFAGLLPFIIDLWAKGQTMENAFQILSSVNDWAIILGAALIGQMIVYAIPQAIATLTLAHGEGRVKVLNKNLDLLRESWGQDVATTKPIDKIISD